jgi:hypothetical protein
MLRKKFNYYKNKRKEESLNSKLLSSRNEMWKKLKDLPNPI